MTTTIVTIHGKTRNLIFSWFVLNIPLSENMLETFKKNHFLHFTFGVKLINLWTNY